MVVATDSYDSNEAEKTDAIIPPDVGAELPKAGDEVVVGVAYWKFEPESQREGQFSNIEGKFSFLISSIPSADFVCRTVPNNPQNFSS